MTARLTLSTATADETRSLGAALSDLVGPGDVITLSGEHGAGKTCLVQGLARGLGVTTPVTSPTFMLQRIHDGHVRLVHLDVYRLDRLHDVVGLGDEAFAPDVVTAVEWGDAIAGLLPGDRIEIELSHADEDDVDAPVELAADGGLVDLPRTVVVTLRGRWVAERDRIAAALEAHWIGP
jgi:tRNA threonylcarbamoyladenosine biosynthesis protein TsaE